ncbi:SDR family oxidoreductase [Evansella sp. AB-P1]|uniref:SDR family NAD(P)-dependent oxidoreductase n=1 Tax=Evansella sp. AB-P1 TaxID=3037653 RepID=UPI00241C85D6|nr:SDR family oxidoreductase [Evansella sp. AB-P1]MDG5787710.1 SDR family oxidoreductase [Evansella sp. AB-P1]
MNKLQGLNVVITGASSGIGEQLSYEVAKRGGTPIMLARSYDKLVDLADQIEKETDVKPIVYRVDVAEEESVKGVFAKVEKENGPIDVLINNAGFGVFEPAHESSLGDVKLMFNVNVFGAIGCTQAVLPSMMNRKKGHIIFVASQAGKLATPKSSAYSATKHAVLGYANSLRMEMQEESIYVSVVNPGPVKTQFFDLADRTGDYKKSVARFMITAEEVAKKTVNLIEKPKRELNLPAWMNVGTKFYQVFPSLVEKIAGNQLRKK